MPAPGGVCWTRVVGKVSRNRMTKQGFLPQGQPTMADLCETATDKLLP